MKTLIIARHGNTFAPGQTPTRVGAHTDLDLVEDLRGRAVGKYLKAKGLMPDRVLAAPLLRTVGTAQLAAQELGFDGAIIRDARFLEIDYGPDENLPENVVELQLGARMCEDSRGMNSIDIQAIGKDAIELWNQSALVPLGWKIDVDQVKANWLDLAASMADDETLLCVSSNGTIRFAPVITGDYEAFCQLHDIKVATGSVSIFTSEDGVHWLCAEWGTKAHKLV